MPSPDTAPASRFIITPFCLTPPRARMTSSASPLLDWQDGQPLSTRFGDRYFSRHSGMDESRHVFLQHNHLAERWAALPQGGRFVIGETGFGTGLNFLCAWQLWRQHAPAQARLHFISTEKYPLAPAELAQALALWPALAELASQLQAQYAALPPGWHRFHFDADRVTLTLLVGDALDTLPQLDRASSQVDAWFLDGFAPACNPELWSPALFAQLARLSAPGASFATFTSAGVVKRGLAEAGFSVRRARGFRYKWHMLCGNWQGEPACAWQPPWYAWPAHVGEQRALVIGGGISGAAAAASLARRGWQVTVLEQQAQLADGASGNAQGVLHTKLSPHLTPLTRLLLSGYAYSLRQLHHGLPRGEAWDACGIVQLGFDADEQQRHAGLAALGLPAEVLHAVSAEQASALTGLTLDHSGLWLGQGGWVHPPAWVRQLAATPGISVELGCTIDTLSHDGQHWLAHARDGRRWCSPVVVVATAHHAARFAQLAHLPLNPIRGQVSHAAATPASQALRAVLCGESYISPARLGQHCFGATFRFKQTELAVTTEEHQENLDKLAALTADGWARLGGAALTPAQLGGRSGWRATTPDYLPLVGPVAQAEQFAQHYPTPERCGPRQPGPAAPWWPGLYVSLAHGSRGLITAPLAGEALAAALHGDPAPLPGPLLEALHPNRFLLRAQKRRHAPERRP